MAQENYNKPLTRKEKDLLRLLNSECHLGNTNYNRTMERYIHHVTPEGVPIFNVEDTLNKIKLAARIIAGVENLEDVMVVSSRDLGQRAVIKFATYTGTVATSNARWTPGILTNHQTRHFVEPRLIVVVDTYADKKAIIEASYMGIPCIALANSDSSLQYVDVAIPCNNKSTFSISMVFWLLAREVRVLTGRLDRDDDDWKDVMVDLFYYKNIEDVQKNIENEQQNQIKEKEGGDWDQNKNDEEEDKEEWAESM